MSFGRITNQMTTQQVLSNINAAQNRLDVTQEELSSGKKLSQPSDDPYGASEAVQLNGQLSQLGDYSDQVTDGTAWTQASDTALQSIQNEVQRVRELVVEAANGSNSQSNLSAINSEVTQLTASIKQDANAQYNGQYIFSGTATTTAPYTSSSDAYQGNAGAVNRTIGPGTSVQVNADVSSVLGSGASAGDGKLLNVLSNISADLTSGNTTALSTTDLSGLDSNISTLEQVQATVGSTEDRLQLAATRISSLQTSGTSQLSDVQDADYATTMTDFTNEEAAFTAALKASANIVQSSLMDFLQ
jgi:flagellar hook-associated protein 3 FlgL